MSFIAAAGHSHRHLAQFRMRKQLHRGKKIIEITMQYVTPGVHNHCPLCKRQTHSLPNLWLPYRHLVLKQMNQRGFFPIPSQGLAGKSIGITQSGNLRQSPAGTAGYAGDGIIGYMNGQADLIGKQSVQAMQ